ncbi:papain-like cysteine protease family protein [Isosphaeraceae bacterium EP7]
MGGDLDVLIGKWIVKVRPIGRPDPWTWEYEFHPSGRVTWQDLKGAEKGVGTWASTSTLVNLSWNDSATRESWSRPLTPTPPPNKTWYESSYYKGQYQVEKPLCPGFSTDAPFKLEAPGDIQQKGLLCWAAGSASWLQGTKRGNTTVEELVKKFKAAGKLDSDNALREEHMIDVFLEIGITLKLMPAVDFTYCFALEKLKTKGHLVLMSGSPGNAMGHTRVVYGVGEPSNEYFNVFDPLENHGYELRRFSELSGNIYVGWAK